MASLAAAFDVYYDLVIMGVGVFIFMMGYCEARKRWMIRNIPTSPIRSVALGLAEINGFARAKLPLVSPQWGVECVYFRYTIEELKRTYNGYSQWSVIEQGASAAPFYVEDETGTILVDPVDADPAQPYSNRSVEGRLRRTEWHIRPGDLVYVLGTVRKNRGSAEDHAERVNEILRQVKRDPQAMKVADTDGDGRIDIPEWNAVRDTAELSAQAAEIRDSIANPQDELVIAQGDTEKTFIISVGDETAIASRYFWFGTAQVLLGLGVVIVFAAHLLTLVLPDYQVITNFF